MNRIRLLLSLGLLLLASMGLYAQEGDLLKAKSTRIIAKLDLYWSAVTIADNFPSFFPLELEINLPKPRLSVEAMISPWHRRFNTQTTSNAETVLWGGLGLRYYFFERKFPDAATGFFLEPQVFCHYKRTYTDPIVSEPFSSSRFNLGYFIAVGYQHALLDWLYLQGRVSAGFGADDDMVSYSIGDQFMVLPWVGIGIGLH